jgi:hypothetical protein
LAAGSSSTNSDDPYCRSDPEAKNLISMRPNSHPSFYPHPTHGVPTSEQNLRTEPCPSENIGKRRQSPGIGGLMMFLHAKDGWIIGHAGFEHETNAETSRSRLPGFAVRSHGVFVFFFLLWVPI